MAVRVTRQVVEVLSSPDLEQSASSTLSLSQDVQISGGKVRITRQVIEALVSETALEPSVTSVLSLTHNAEQKGTVQSASSVLFLAGQVQDNSKQFDVQNQLNLVQSAAHNFKLASVANVLTLSDLATHGQDKLESPISILALIQTVSQNQKPESVTNLLNLKQDIILVVNNDNIVSVESELSLTHNAQLGNFIFNRSVGHDILDQFNLFEITHSVVTGGTRSLAVSDLISFIQQVSLNKTLNLSLTSFLSLAQQLGRVFDESTSSVLSLLQIAERILTVSSILDLTQAVVVFNQRNVRETLVLNQVVAVVGEFARLASNNLNLVQTVGLRFGVIDTCQYDPQVGSGGISTVAPTFGTAILTLTYPFITPTTTLVLRNPNFGNTENLKFSRINRESRGGTLLIFRDPTWPKQEALSITIDLLDETQKDDLLIFFQDSLGKEIGLLDNENRQWKGIIINPDAEVTHLGVCNYSVTFEFEGEIQ